MESLGSASGPSLSATSTWRMRGIALSAMRPRASGSVGTSRQHRTSRSCEARQRSSTASARVSSSGRNTMPTPSRRSCERWLPVSARRSARGTAVIRPTPSLLLPSAAVAPRWARRESAVRECWTISCVGWPVSVATKPTPQESWSKRGSIRDGGAAGRESSHEIRRTRCEVTGDERIAVHNLLYVAGLLKGRRRVLSKKFACVWNLRALDLRLCIIMHYNVSLCIERLKILSE